MTIPSTFRAFRIHDAHGYRSGIERISLDELNPGEGIVVKAAYSSVNYRTRWPAPARQDPAQVPAGRRHRHRRACRAIDRPIGFREGDAVLVTGSGLSETRDGGYAEYARARREMGHSAARRLVAARA